jgi:colanic acid biosynthesis glycosyl transferase WcaI
LRVGYDYDFRTVFFRIMKQRILLLTPIFPPELYMSASMMAEMAEELVLRGYQVYVFTTIPSRPGGTTLPEYRTKPWIVKESVHGYTLIRVRSWQIGNNRSKVNRIMENLIFGFISGCYLLFSRRFDRIVSIPWPNVCAVIQAFAAKVRGFSYYYFIMDLLPEQAESAGLLRSDGFVHRWLLWIDRTACRFSQGIITLSAGLKKHIVASRHVSDNNVLVASIQVDIKQLQVSRECSATIKEELGIPQDHLLILYSGTLGYVSGIDMLKDILPAIPQNAKVFFLIIGEGPLAQSIEDLAIKYPNIMKYLPFQPTVVFRSILFAADVTLVTMNPQSGIGSVPSKMYSYMAAGKPVLAAVPADSEVHRLVDSLGCGILVDSNDVSAFVNSTMTLSHHYDELRLMGITGKRYVEQCCNVNTNVNALEKFWQ